jgi:hypothetical protein
MSKVGRGRPRLNNNNVAVNDLTIEFLSTKKDNYENDISYFKITDPSFRVKLKPLFILSNDDVNLKMPYWVTDKNEHILKVKTKFVVNHIDLIQHVNYVININFEYYHMEQANIKGYYGKVTKLMAIACGGVADIEISDDN